MKYAATSKQLMHRSALYAVWEDMRREARQEQDFNNRYHINRRTIEDEFLDFDMFAMWARLEQGYEIGRDDNKQIARKDTHAPFGPDNCYFIERDAFVLASDMPAEISKGASGAFKTEPRWNGLSKTRLYNIWKTMCRMCSDTKWKDYAKYGGRGIRVQDEWRKDFLAFEDWAWEHGYNDQLSLSRLDQDKGFTPNNCRWETSFERRAYNLRKYEKIRLTVKRMREYLGTLDDCAVVTLIVSTNHVMPCEAQDDFPPTPVEDRIDSARS